MFLFFCINELKNLLEYLFVIVIIYDVYGFGVDNKKIVGDNVLLFFYYNFF